MDDVMEITTQHSSAEVYGPIMFPDYIPNHLRAFQLSEPKPLPRSTSVFPVSVANRETCIDHQVDNEDESTISHVSNNMGIPSFWDSRLDSMDGPDGTTIARDVATLNIQTMGSDLNSISNKAARNCMPTTKDCKSQLANGVAKQIIPAHKYEPAKEKECACLDDGYGKTCFRGFKLKINCNKHLGTMAYSDIKTVDQDLARKGQNEDMDTLMTAVTASDMSLTSSSTYAGATIRNRSMKSAGSSKLHVSKGGIQKIATKKHGKVGRNSIPPAPTLQHCNAHALEQLGGVAPIRRALATDDSHTEVPNWLKKRSCNARKSVTVSTQSAVTKALSGSKTLNGMFSFAISEEEEGITASSAVMPENHTTYQGFADMEVHAVPNLDRWWDCRKA